MFLLAVGGVSLSGIGELSFACSLMMPRQILLVERCYHPADIRDCFITAGKRKVSLFGGWRLRGESSASMEGWRIVANAQVDVSRAGGGEALKTWCRRLPVNYGAYLETVPARTGYSRSFALRRGAAEAKLVPKGEQTLGMPVMARPAGGRILAFLWL